MRSDLVIEYIAHQYQKIAKLPATFIEQEEQEDSSSLPQMSYLPIIHRIDLGSVIEGICLVIYRLGRLQGRFGKT